MRSPGTSPYDSGVVPGIFASPARTRSSRLVGSNPPTEVTDA